MNKNKNLFEKTSHKKGSFKYFIIAFGVFILVLAIASVFMFMYSIDFNFDNFVDKPDEETTSSVENITDMIYSVNSLTGKSTVLFVCTDTNRNLDFAFTVTTDYDNKSMKVKCVDAETQITYDGKSQKCGALFEQNSVSALKNAIYESFEIKVDKYFVCERTGARNVLSLFDGVTLNIGEAINYESEDISVELDSGKQTVSGAYALNYLLISNNAEREQTICDIINSVLVPQYVDDAQDLFTSFVNSGKTDISVIDYSESIDNITIYAYSDDKFLPITSVED